MNRLSLMSRVRSLTRDLSNSIFREVDVIDYINEGIERIQGIVPEMLNMVPLLVNDDVPILLPSQYHHLLALYSASRCFGQDERHYQASNFMNEFEQKIDEMKTKIESGELIIIDPTTGVKIVVDDSFMTDYVVTDNYFESRAGRYNDDFVLPDSDTLIEED